MTVAELIDVLSKLDPNARVIASTRCQFDDDSPYLSGFEQVIEGVEVGFSDEHIEWDLSFQATSEGYVTVPSVRLLGHLDKRATPTG